MVFAGRDSFLGCYKGGFYFVLNNALIHTYSILTASSVKRAFHHAK